MEKGCKEAVGGILLGILLGTLLYQPGGVGGSPRAPFGGTLENRLEISQTKILGL